MTMNIHWKAFLAAQHALFDENAVDSALAPLTLPAVCAIRHLAVISITGNDAATFLQGQITCNVHDTSIGQSRLGAICTPKGRTIAVFVLVRQAEQFLLVVPATQLPSVKNHLQKYLLRAAVSLTDSTDSLCLLGQWSSKLASPPLLITTPIDNGVSIAFANRELVIAPPDQAMALWLTLVGQGFKATHPAWWRHADINTGIPWLCPRTAEHYIPQMLDLDRMGGISFNKGCYTGQEVIARTHFLGQAKRALFVGNCAALQTPAPQSDIINAPTQETIGHVLAAQCLHGSCQLMMVLQQPESGFFQAALPDATPITLTAINYD